MPRHVLVAGLRDMLLVLQLPESVRQAGVLQTTRGSGEGGAGAGSGQGTTVIPGHHILDQSQKSGWEAGRQQGVSAGAL